MLTRHNCGEGGWAHCIGCDGRIHEGNCTTHPNPLRDCCHKRHQALAALGVTHSLYEGGRPIAYDDDKSIAALSEKESKRQIALYARSKYYMDE